MNGLISHPTTAEFVQVIIESWNELLLLTMVFIISIGVSRDRRNELIGRSNIPMTSELLVFFVAVLFYDLSDMLFTIFQDTDTRYSSLILNISMYIYYVSGGFQTLFFLHVVKKNIAESGGDNRLKKMIIGFQALQIPCFLLLAITPLTGAIYHFNDENVYVRSWGFIVWQGVTIITFVFIGAVVILKWKSTESVVKQIILTATILPLLALSSSVVIDADRFHMNNIIIMITDLILFTMYDQRLNVSRQVVEEVEKYFPDKVFQTKIPRNVRLSEAPSFGKPVMYYDKSSKGAFFYELLGKEVLGEELDNLTKWRLRLAQKG